MTEEKEKEEKLVYKREITRKSGTKAEIAGVDKKIKKKGKPKPEARFGFQFQPVIVPIKSGQGPTEWEKAKGETLNVVKKLEKLVPNYSYEDIGSSAATDDRICAIVIEGLSKVKMLLFETINYLYELYKEDKVNKKLVSLRDSVDIFSDEIKARYCRWKGINDAWLRKIIRSDWDLIKGVEGLQKDIESLKKGVFSIKMVRVNKDLVEYDMQDWEKYKEQIRRIESELNDLVIMFKERETICNIKAMSLDKTFQIIKNEIRNKI